MSLLHPTDAEMIDRLTVVSRKIEVGGDAALRSEFNELCSRVGISEREALLLQLSTLNNMIWDCIAREDHEGAWRLNVRRGKLRGEEKI